MPSMRDDPEGRERLLTDEAMAQSQRFDLRPSNAAQSLQALAQMGVDPTVLRALMSGGSAPSVGDALIAALLGAPPSYVGATSGSAPLDLSVLTNYGAPMSPQDQLFAELARVMGTRMYHPGVPGGEASAVPASYPGLQPDRAPARKPKPKR